MCGICGEIRFNDTRVDESKMRHMMESIAKRGPDHSDEY